METLLLYYELDSSFGDSLTELFKYHLCQVRINSFTVQMQVVADNKVKETGETVKTISSVKLGTGVYLTASLLNHSCCPNATLKFV